jgi:hypothetical protein
MATSWQKEEARKSDGEGGGGETLTCEVGKKVHLPSISWPGPPLESYDLPI